MYDPNVQMQPRIRKASVVDRGGERGMLSDACVASVSANVFCIVMPKSAPVTSMQPRQSATQGQQLSSTGKAHASEPLNHCAEQQQGIDQYQREQPRVELGQQKCTCHLRHLSRRPRSGKERGSSWGMLTPAETSGNKTSRAKTNCSTRCEVGTTCWLAIGGWLAVLWDLKPTANQGQSLAPVTSCGVSELKDHLTIKCRAPCVV